MSDTSSLVDRVTGHRRMRRNRKADWTRRMVQETRVTVDDLIWPLFLVPAAASSSRLRPCPVSTA